jgi:hypothetical protein
MINFLSPYASDRWWGQWTIDREPVQRRPCIYSMSLPRRPEVFRVVLHSITHRHARVVFFPACLERKSFVLRLGGVVNSKPHQSWLHERVKPRLFNFSIWRLFFHQERKKAKGRRSLLEKPQKAACYQDRASKRPCRTSHALSLLDRACHQLSWKDAC